ncbi:MAG: hypothetical protein ACREOM_12040 [Candidatus Dormibacteraceae bacterium]
MAEEPQRRQLSSEAAQRELKDMIEQWVNVIDRWVQGRDARLGGGTDVGEPRQLSAQDSSPGASAFPSRAGTG